MIKTILKILLLTLPFVLFAFFNAKVNLKRKVRCKQFLMPIFAVVYCIVAVIFLSKISNLLLQFVSWIPQFLQNLPGALSGLGDKLAAFFAKINLPFLVFFITNAVLLLVHVVLKLIVARILKLIFKTDNALSNALCGIFYEYDDEGGYWYLQEHFGRMRTFLKSSYIFLTILSVLAILASSVLYLKGLLLTPYYPVFALILVGELYFLVNGLNKEETKSTLSGEAEQASTTRDYALLRKALCRLFPDKLNTEDTTVDNDVAVCSNEELLTQLEWSENFPLRAYGAFMQKKLEKGMELDQNYLASGRQLLCGESVLFNNPFYRDLIPYMFFPLQRVLLQHGRGLIILGRHGIEEDAINWCNEGLTAVTNVPPLWSAEVLTGTPSDPHVGIISMSSINDITLLEANREYFHSVGFVIILEPSRLITTSQLGLNTIVRFCRESGTAAPVFCSADKNCDGLVDALSHVLMTSIREVSATQHHTGTNSYMCWEADDEPMQHRMLPNISRFLGFGTELAFAALHQQIPCSYWYGGEAFPVEDMHWIARQYYFDLLSYANLPTTQETMDEVFRVSSNLWSAPSAKSGVFVVEDESFNMFEVRRAFATRAKEQGFINVLSTAYLLRDYMAENYSIFSTDSKAIPYVTADYARTNRNVALRLCLRLCSGSVPEQDIRREMMLLDRKQELQTALWHLICEVCGDEDEPLTDARGFPMLRCGAEVFPTETLEVVPKYSFESGEMENRYSISDSRFAAAVLHDIQNAAYIAEDENSEAQYLGSELMGQVFQKRLPGQFFTFCGKYYEMLRVTDSGKVILRRAADHINGRPTYRQERRYFISQIKDSEVMGEIKKFGTFNVCRQTANLRVETPAYWSLARYNDFKTGVHTDINGVPNRAYRRKQLLRIDFPEEVSPQILQTMALLIHEVLRSMLAENQDFIAVVTPAGCTLPLTYSISGEDGTELSQNCIYILEDSQMDIGLLAATERNLKRIFEIVYDYLLWHNEALEHSLHPQEQPETPDYVIPESEIAAEKEEKRKRNIFRRFFGAIGRFFKKLFRKKPKEEEEPVSDDPAAPAPTDENGQKRKREKKRKKKKSEPVPNAEDAEQQPMVSEPSGSLPYEAADNPVLTAEPDETADMPDETADTLEEQDEAPDQPLFSRFFRASTQPDGEPEAQPVSAQSEEPQDAQDIEDGNFSFENETLLAQGNTDFRRKPYHERYYLLYGAAQMPEWLDTAGVLALLEALGCGNNYLTQARRNRNAAEFIENSFVPNRKGVHYCDFCGCELTGTEYDTLADGRERCVRCGKTAVRSADEFKNIYKKVSRNLNAFFGVSISKSVKISMVNSKRLHKALGKTFIPTGDTDGRVLGVAIKSQDGYTILMENGAPALQSTMTMVHELTHIWQYLNWDEKSIRRKYGKALNLEIYEGMAKWVEIQYAYLVNEAATAKREELITKARDDEYGRGFLKYLARYPLATGFAHSQTTPFDNKEQPL